MVIEGLNYLDQVVLKAGEKIVATGYLYKHTPAAKQGEYE